MADLDYEYVLKLCHQVRLDLKRMLKAVREREFYEISNKAGQAARSGIVFEAILPELERLENMIQKMDLETIAKGDSQIYGLVDFYEHLIQVIRSSGAEERDNDHLVQELHRWRDNVGTFAQMLCRLEDGD